MRNADVAVVGGGIVGLAFAGAAARRGKSVVLFERSPAAAGASVRNFGMIWPIGQPPGPLYRLALRSRDQWLELGRAAGFWVGECGSIHAAHADDERAVLEEFAALAPGAGVRCEYLPAKDAVQRFPALNSDGLRGVLYSSVEAALDPRQALSRLPHFLAASHGVQIQFGSAVTGIEMPRLRTADGTTWTADRVFVCSGIDFETLFPESYAAAGLRRCKLQMMRTAPQPGGWRLGPHIAGGLTLGHYKAFEACSTLPALKRRLADEYAEHLRYGIHVMAAQNHLGEVLIGDSHEYDDYSPFDSSRIDGLILEYLRRLVRLPESAPAARWHGVYAKHATLPVVTVEPQPGCTVVAGVGGAGMTLSFGLAEEWWDAQEKGAPFDPGGRMTAAELLDRIDRLFAERGAVEYHGEAVTQLAHALQAAGLAEESGAPCRLVAAALLHDVGHLLHPQGQAAADDRHEELGHRFLARHFGPTVAEPVRLHVPAKRYLCATEPGYATGLTEASRRSLQLQGGPMSPGEVAAFETNPYAVAAIALRRWDDAAKVVGRATPSFAHYRRHLEVALAEHPA